MQGRRGRVADPPEFGMKVISFGGLDILKFPINSRTLQNSTPPRRHPQETHQLPKHGQPSSPCLGLAEQQPWPQLIASSFLLLRAEKERLKQSCKLQGKLQQKLERFLHSLVVQRAAAQRQTSTVKVFSAPNWSSWCQPLSSCHSTRQQLQPVPTLSVPGKAPASCRVNTRLVFAKDASAGAPQEPQETGRNHVPPSQPICFLLQCGGKNGNAGVQKGAWV